MRKRIFEIIEAANGEDTPSAIYDGAMIVLIAASIIPLAYKETTPLFDAVDRITVSVFIMDYLLRWITADFKLKKGGIGAFLRYPFTGMAVIDLLSILPSLVVLNKGFRLLRFFRMARALRVLRVFKAVRYSKNIRTILNVLRDSKESMGAVCVLAGIYIVISAMIIFNVEPDSFGSFFDALYWATISLTTVGYGDIYPVSSLGRFIAMVSSIFGIAIVALPAGIFSAKYIREIGRQDEEEHSDR